MRVRLVVTEKNIAAKKLAEILAVGKPKADKVSGIPVYHFRRDGEDWASIGLKGHILGVDFPPSMHFENGAWKAVWEEGKETKAALPDDLPTPPWPKKGKPYTASGIDLKTWKVASLPYLVWAPVGKIPAERDIISALKTMARKAEEIVIATDYDREGELIGSDARSIVREVNKKSPVYRARFSAITKDEIEHAFAELSQVDDCLAQAGESRQDIDLVWGAVLTRFLTMAKFGGYGNVRSAGRVQTPTLSLVVEREREREAFVPEVYWTVKGQFACCDDRATREEFSAGHATDKFKSAEAAQAVLDAVAGAKSGRVTAIEKKTRKAQPPTPFNTTELQATAAAEGLAPARTMRIAESLYMDGLISYPRVDNTVYPPSLDLHGILRTLSGVPEYAQHANRILSAPLHATRGKKETTDHPPIHPTGAPADLEKLKPEQRKLYNLVARRFMATLSGPATLEGTKVTVDVQGEPFVARGDVLVEPGFRAVYHYGLKKDTTLPSLAEGQEVDFLGAESEQKQTEPPRRYSQGTLIQEMEKRGLGTKATRHAIIDRLYQVGYAVNDPIEPTCLGRAVIDALSQFAPRITTPDMTAELEAEMDAIANGRTERVEVVEHSRALLSAIMGQLIEKSTEVGDALKEATAEDSRVGTCPKCGKDLGVKHGKTGQFVGCSGWPECDVTYPLPKGKIEALSQVCDSCGAPRIKVVQFRSKPIERCVNPQCETNHEPEIDIGACPVCSAAGRDSGRVTARRSPKTLKRYARCVNYDECQVSYPLPQSGEITTVEAPCATCGAPEIVVQTRRGPWQICVNPECPSKAEKSEAGGGTAKRGGSKTTRSRSTRSTGTKKGSTTRARKPKSAAGSGESDVA